MITEETITAAYEAQGKALEGLYSAHELVAHEEHELECARILVMAKNSPKDLGPNETAQKMKMNQLCEIEINNLAMAETEERQARYQYSAAQIAVKRIESLIEFLAIRQ